MTWVPNEQEVKSVLELTGADRYTYFIKKTADQQELWSLWSEGWVLASDDAGRELIPVWPHKKYADLCAKGGWEGSIPKLIELEAWVDRWIDGAKRDGRLIAVFPTPGSSGVVVDPSQLASDINLELANYE